MWVALLRSPRNDPGQTLRRTQSGHLEHWNYFVRLTLRSVAFRRHKHSEFVPKDTQWKLQHSHSSFNRKRQFAKRNSPSKSSTKVNITFTRFGLNEIRSSDFYYKNYRKQEFKGIIVGIDKIEIDLNIIYMMKEFNSEYDEELIQKQLLQNRHNHETTYYYLLI